LGFAEAQLNRTEAAIRDLAEAHRLDPTISGVTQTLARLQTGSF